MFNISHHVFVPKHTIIGPDEVKELEQAINVKLKNLPRIKREDPMAKYIGARPGQVIKLIALSATTGTTTTYRQCE